MRVVVLRQAGAVGTAERHQHIASGGLERGDRRVDGLRLLIGRTRVNVEYPPHAAFPSVVAWMKASVRATCRWTARSPTGSGQPSRHVHIRGEEGLTPLGIGRVTGGEAATRATG